MVENGEGKKQTRLVHNTAHNTSISFIDLQYNKSKRKYGKYTHLVAADAIYAGVPGTFLPPFGSAQYPK